MKNVIFKITFLLLMLLSVGCENDNNGPLDGTVWVRTWEFKSETLNCTTHYKNTLKFEATTYSKECYSDYKGGGIYASHSGIYDISDYPSVVMCDTEGSVSIAKVDGNELRINNKTYYKQ